VPTKISVNLLAMTDRKASHLVYKRFVCHAFVQNALDSLVSNQAVIDTGSTFSILPRRLWRDNEFVDLAPAAPGMQSIRGISGGELPCKFGHVRVMLADTEPTFSDWLEVPAKLAEADTVPLILGVAGFLDRYELVLNSDGASYIAVPGPAFTFGG